MLFGGQKRPLRRHAMPLRHPQSEEGELRVRVVAVEHQRGGLGARRVGLRVDRLADMTARVERFDWLADAPAAVALDGAGVGPDAPLVLTVQQALPEGSNERPILR